MILFIYSLSFLIWDEFPFSWQISHNISRSQYQYQYRVARAAPGAGQLAVGRSGSVLAIIEIFNFKSESEEGEGNQREMSTWSSGGGVGNRSLEMFYYTSTSIFSIQIKKLCGVNKSHKKSSNKYFVLAINEFHARYRTSFFTKTCWIKSFLLTKNIFVHRTGIHKSLSYHRKAGIGSHLII